MYRESKKMKKKGIYINALGEVAWIGGLYYKKNIIFSILQNNNIKEKYNIIVVVNKEYAEIFREFESYVKLIVVDRFDYKFRLKQIIYILKYNIKFFYPTNKDLLKRILGIKCIDWIPDFQHKYYPEFFDQNEIDKREKCYKKISKSSDCLVLSSYTAANDFEKFYGKHNNVYVVPFVSYIQNEINNISESDQREVLRKYDLSTDYICISNQFWKHKNHIIILKTIKYMNENGIMPNDLKFVFTGYPEDKRNPEYYNQLMELLSDKNISDYVKLLGFIDRKEQIIVMQKSKFIIQPSLFEGWGTVVEDAKVLDKIMLLSDIPVHREQMNERGMLFDPYSEVDLSDKILKILKIKHQDCIEAGIEDMYKRAGLYSKNFEKLLFDI